MRLRTVTILLVVAVLAVVIAAVIVGTATGPRAGLADSAGAGSSAVESGAGTEAGQASRSPAAATPTPGAPHKDKTDKNKPDKNKPDDGGPSSGKEGNPSISTPVPYRLPGSTPPDSTPPAPKALVSAPLPATASARGSIVKGFPAVIPQAPESTITFSSVATEGDRMQMGLEATTSVSADGVLSYYRTVFEPLGLVAAPAPAVEGSAALSFVRGGNGITVTVSTSAGSARAHYIVTGIFIAGT